MAGYLSRDERKMAKDYVELKDGAYRIAGTRVSLDSVVYAFLNGAAPESIQRSYSALTLEQVYGAIAFYLSRRAEIDQYLIEGEKLFEELREASRKAHPDFYKKLERARKEILTSQS